MFLNIIDTIVDVVLLSLNCIIFYFRMMKFKTDAALYKTLTFNIHNFEVLERM